MVIIGGPLDKRIRRSVTINADYRVTIPRDICKMMDIRPGDAIKFLPGPGIHFIPVRKPRGAHLT